MGITRFSSSVINNIKKIYFTNLKLNEKKFKKIDMTSFLNFLIKKKISITPLSLNGNWNEYDDITDLKYDMKL